MGETVTAYLHCHFTKYSNEKILGHGVNLNFANVFSALNI